MSAAACLVFNCDTCTHMIRGRCSGCQQGNTELINQGGEPCAIYKCVISRNLSSCSECQITVCPFTHDMELVCPVRAHYEKKRCYVRKLSEHFLERQYGNGKSEKGSKISDKTITRLRWYLFALNDFLAHDVTSVSSNDLSRKVGVRPWLIRRDLSQFGEFGRPSIGYDAAFLRDRLSAILHLGDTKNVMWVGSARLAAEISLIKRFDAHGFKIVSILDDDPEAPSKVDNIDVTPIDDANRIVQDFEAGGAVIAVHEEDAQAVAERLIAAGVYCILNLTAAIIVVPTHIQVRNVDIVAELFALSYYCGETKLETAQ